MPTDSPGDFNNKAFANLAAQVAATAQYNASTNATHQNALHTEGKASAAESVTYPITGGKGGDAPYLTRFYPKG